MRKLEMLMQISPVENGYIITTGAGLTPDRSFPTTWVAASLSQLLEVIHEIYLGEPESEPPGACL